MKLINLQIKKFRAIDQLDLSLLDAIGRPRPITVVAGPNGSGKTSILFAIVNALRGVMGYRTADVPVPKPDDIHFSSGDARKWTREAPKAQVVLHLKLDEDELDAIPRLLQQLEMQPPPPLPDGCLKVTWTFPPGYSDDGTKLGWWTASIDPPHKYIRSWLMARSLAIRAWNRREGQIGPEFLRRIGGLKLFPQDRNLRERVLPSGIETVPTLNGLVPDGDTDEGREFDARPFHERTVTDILHFLSDYAQKRVPPLPDDQNWEKRVQEIFRDICKPKEYLGYMYRGQEDPVGAPVLKDGDSEYPLENAASGEQVILEYITRLTHPSPLENSIILVDEPEIHLHPAWIRKLYLALPRIGNANQYILTTHADELRKRAAADNCLIDLGNWGDAE
ncbi:MAG: AAA family ATPase [Phycisphaerales bacterium]|nr:AAA family ATPase [Phycisphaerales bacterium]